MSAKISHFLKRKSILSMASTRFNSSAASKLFYTQYGEPLDVITKETSQINDPGPDEVLIKMIAAPVNPADINTIQGKYPSKPSLPAVPGNEGVGRIIKLGSNVTELAEGSHVIPLKSNLGTWQTHLKVTKTDVLQVPKQLGIVEAATLIVNPCTALRMLRDFVLLKPGDTVIQNGANSACGQYVIQICRTWGVNTVNVVRNRPNITDLKDYLKKLGATTVLTEEELRTTDIFKSGKINTPTLALNCVGGKNALECLRYLKHGSTMVTYGGMSREPLTVPTSALIFKDLQFKGFWMTRWSNENATSADRFEMFEELITMMVGGELQGPTYEMIDFDNYKQAVTNALTEKGMIGKKYILKFE